MHLTFSLQQTNMGDIIQLLHITNVYLICHYHVPNKNIITPDTHYFMYGMDILISDF